MRAAVLLGLLVTTLAFSTAAEARGCWRPNGWCRRAQREREAAIAAAAVVAAEAEAAKKPAKVKQVPKKKKQ